MKLVISGGHLTPALAVIEEFRRNDPNAEVLFIGREYAQEKEKMKSKEKEEMEKRNIPFYAIRAAKFHRTYMLRNMSEMLRMMPSLKEVREIFLQEKPDIFLSFGGYLAIPIALVSKLMKIPVITHEQTRTAGLANSLIAKLADIVAVSSEQSIEYFPKNKVVVTGNPLRPAFLQQYRKKPEWLKRISPSLPMVYITGGSQGSHVINQNLMRIIPQLVKKAVVIHQCGASDNSSYLREMEQVKITLPEKERKHYVLREWISEEEVAWLFQQVDVVVARAGANTVQEVAISKVPAVFIPLPFSHDNEQLKNAQWLSQAGSAVILPQKDLSPVTLYENISLCLRRKVRMRANAEAVSKDIRTDASEHLIRLCRELHAKYLTQQAII